LGRYAIRFAGRNDWIDCFLIEKDGDIFRFEKTNNPNEKNECRETEILGKKKWISDVNPRR